MEYALMVILVGILGILMVATPRGMWELQHMFTVRDGEPTEFALVMIRISGVFCIAMVIFAIVAPILFE